MAANATFGIATGDADQGHNDGPRAARAAPGSVLRDGTRYHRDTGEILEDAEHGRDCGGRQEAWRGGKARKRPSCR